MEDNRADNTLEGYVETIPFRNEENGFTVFVVSKSHDETTCTGNIASITTGQYICLKGNYVEHAVYGRQFAVSSYIFREPHSSEAFLRFIASGGVPGIRKRRAEKIIDRFGGDSYRIMMEEPEKLAKEIKGVSKAQAYEFQRILVERKQENDARIFLQDLGIGAALSEKVYKFYGDKIYSIIKENPYRLAEDITSIGFKTADDIVMRSGAQVDVRFRIRAALTFALETATASGHTYLPLSELKARTQELIGSEIADIEAFVTDMAVDKKIVAKTSGESAQDIRVYLPSFYHMELNVADRLRSLFLAGADFKGQEKLPFGDDKEEDRVSVAIDEIEKEGDIVFDEVQRQAIISGVTKGFSVITGGPGTGKTTLINAIIKIFCEAGLSVDLAAPTGRAAKRLSESSGMDAVTIHRLLGYAPAFAGDEEESEDSRMAFEYNNENPLETDVVIVDEMSMVDLWLMNALLNAIENGTRLILVGDCDQLPSVGAGNVLGDVIDSGVFPVVRLEKIFRQAAMSDIISNAHRINKGEPVDLEKQSRDFLFIKRDTDEKIISAIYTLVTDKLPKYVEADPSEIQILTPSRVSKLGVERLNLIMQRFINPPAQDKREKEFRGVIFREGDKVMQIKNDYQLEWRRSRADALDEEGVGVYNGDTGVLTRINTFDETVNVTFDDGRRAQYAFSDMDELELAYAITIHKAQGSEYPAVVIPMYPAPKMLMNRKLLYTAVTRARKCVCLVGLPECFEQMAANVYESKRHSSLKERIKERFEG